MLLQRFIYNKEGRCTHANNQLRQRLGKSINWNIKRWYAGLCLLLLISMTCYSQDVTQVPVATEVVETKIMRHYIGVQANQLLRQLLNFGGTSNNVGNPYLLTYAINSTKSGVGLNFGLGYTYNSSSNGDPITPRTTTDNSLSLRLGIEKKFTIGKRWFSSYGLDFLLDESQNKTETTFNQGNGFPANKTTTEFTNNGTGLGPRFTLNFLISDKIILGTEANYYYRSFTSTQKVTNQPDQTNNPKSFTFAVPAVLYVILKF